MNKKLLFSVTKKDLDITWFSGTGAGGQHRNKHQNCCRINHHDSGVIVTGQEEKSRDKNLKRAFERLTEHPTFKTWLKIETSRMLGTYRSINQKVNEAMKEGNLKVEYGKDINTK